MKHFQQADLLRLGRKQYSNQDSGQRQKSEAASLHDGWVKGTQHLLVVDFHEPLCGCPS